MKEDMVKAKTLEKTTEDYIEALYYYKMYNSPACWKGDPKVVAKELKKLGSETAKRNALKENIKMRSWGLRLDFADTAWSANGKPFTSKELANIFRTIIRKENSLKVLPGEPDPNVPKRKKLAVCGTQTDTAASLDSKYISNKGELKKAAKDLMSERHATGEGSIYSAMESFVRSSGGMEHGH